MELGESPCRESLAHSSNFGKNLSEWKLLMEYAGNEDYSFLCNWYDESQLLRSGLDGQSNVTRQSTRQELMRGLQSFIGGKWVVGWKIINPPQVRVDVFELKTGK